MAKTVRHSDYFGYFDMTEEAKVLKKQEAATMITVKEKQAMKEMVDKLRREAYEAGWAAHMFAQENGRTLDECFKFYMQVVAK